jgi:chromosome segregation ATPase
MEALLGRLAQAQRDVAEALANCETLSTNLRAQVDQLQRSLQLRPDPTAHRRGLMFLAQLQNQIKEQEQALQALKERRIALQTECMEQQRMLDGLAEHRADAQREYAMEAERREAGEADREWISRAHHRLARLAPLPEVSACL